MSMLRNLQSSRSNLSLVASMSGLKVISRLLHWVAQPYDRMSSPGEQCAANVSTEASNSQVTERVAATIYSTNNDSERTVTAVYSSPQRNIDMFSGIATNLLDTETQVAPPPYTHYPNQRSSWNPLCLVTSRSSASPLKASKRTSRIIDPRRKSMVTAIDNYLAEKKRVHSQIRDQFHQVHTLNEKVAYLDAAIDQCDGGGYRRSTVDPDMVASTRSGYYHDKQSVLQQIRQCFQKVQDLQLDLQNAEYRLQQLDDGGEEAAIIREFLQILAESEQSMTSYA